MKILNPFLIITAIVLSACSLGLHNESLPYFQGASSSARLENAGWEKVTIRQASFFVPEQLEDASEPQFTFLKGKSEKAGLHVLISPDDAASSLYSAVALGHFFSKLKCTSKLKKSMDVYTCSFQIDSSEHESAKMMYRVYVTHSDSYVFSVGYYKEGEKTAKDFFESIQLEEIEVDKESKLRWDARIAWKRMEVQETKFTDAFYRIEPRSKPLDKSVKNSKPDHDHLFRHLSKKKPGKALDSGSKQTRKSIDSRPNLGTRNQKPIVTRTPLRDPARNGGSCEPKEFKITYKPKPKLTDAAREAGINGTVRLRVTFQGSGRVGEIVPIKKLGYGLTESAIKAAQKIRFETQCVNGVLKTVVKQVDFDFNQ